MADQRRQFGELRLVSGNANPILAQTIAVELGQALEKAQVDRFDDGEVRVDLDCVVRSGGHASPGGTVPRPATGGRCAEAWDTPPLDWEGGCC